VLEELPLLLQDIAIARRAYEERRALVRRLAVDAGAH
jgi:hypothetical protein